VNQDFFVSWNNKQAADFSAADGNFSFGPVQRVDLLDSGVRAATAGGHKVSRADVVKVMENAANTDLRATETLSLMLSVINSQPVTDPTQASVVSGLQTWLGSGGHRVETSSGSHTYAYADTIRTFDAWWPLLVSGEFKSSLGDSLYNSLVGAMQINESPSGGQQDAAGGGGSLNDTQGHKGSSFQHGWWGYVSKDLRKVLGQPVSNPLASTYCGGGSLASCRSMLLSTLSTAYATPAATTYPADSHCSAGDQWCADSVIQSPLGGITDDIIGWQNRPTYQQVVSFPAHRGDNLANLANGKTATASSVQFLTSNTANKAVDASDSSRWSSSYSDANWLKVDLGSAQTFSRVLLHWESAYGKAYRIDVSNDNSTWTTVWSTSVGDGGLDIDAFAPVTARYVRMQGVTRGTSYGYSLYELEVYTK